MHASCLGKQIASGVQYAIVFLRPRQAHHHITRRATVTSRAAWFVARPCGIFDQNGLVPQSPGGRRGQSYPSGVQFSSGSFEHAVRVLADRLWPGGLPPQIDLWLKQIAPSDAVRWRFHGDAAAKSDGAMD
jgi:hypothetical protein